MDTLPFEIKLTIACLLKVKDVLSLSGTSKQWHDICKQECVWVKLLKTDYHIEAADITIHKSSLENYRTIKEHSKIYMVTVFYGYYQDRVDGRVFKNLKGVCYYIVNSLADEEGLIYEDCKSSASKEFTEYISKFKKFPTDEKYAEELKTYRDKAVQLVYEYLADDNYWSYNLNQAKIRYLVEIKNLDYRTSFNNQ